MGETWAICEDGKFAICLHSPQKGTLVRVGEI